MFTKIKEFLIVKMSSTKKKMHTMQNYNFTEVFRISDIKCVCDFQKCNS